jgi:hypothetical protein
MDDISLSLLRKVRHHCCNGDSDMLVSGLSMSLTLFADCTKLDVDLKATRADNVSQKW